MSIATTYSDLVGMTISGVGNAPYPSNQISTADLPVKYVNYIRSEFEVGSLSQTLGLRKHTFDIVIVLNPLMQGITQENVDAVITYSDLLYDAVDTISNVLSVTNDLKIVTFDVTKYICLIVTIVILE